MLKNDKGEEAVHNRAKGVVLEAIDKYAKETYNIKDDDKKGLNEAKYNTYDRLFNDEKIDFDMTLIKVCFKYNKYRQVTSLSKFSRALKFNGKKNIFAY